VSATLIHSRWTPVILLTCSNVFMTFAWYGHLKHKDASLWLVIPVSWGIAFFEYVLMVPANRWGSNLYSPVQLKVMQEIITLTVFSIFAILYLKTTIRWNHLVAFALIIAAAGFTFLPDSGGSKTETTIQTSNK
jgi:uncharacterized protein